MRYPIIRIEADSLKDAAYKFDDFLHLSVKEVWKGTQYCTEEDYDRCWDSLKIEVQKSQMKISILDDVCGVKFPGFEVKDVVEACVDQKVMEKRGR